MGQENQYDVIIIGSGAGGGTLAYALAATGKRILILERGGYLPREKDNWDTRAVFIDSKYKAKETWFDKGRERVPPRYSLRRGGEHQSLRRGPIAIS